MTAATSKTKNSEQHLVQTIDKFPIDKIVQKLLKFKWKKVSKDKKILIELTAKDAELLAEKIKDTAFDHADIEEGLHDLRRQLRWISIKLQSLNGYVEYFDDSKIINYLKKKFKNHNIKNINNFNLNMILNFIKNKQIPFNYKIN